MSVAKQSMPMIPVLLVALAVYLLYLLVERMFF